MGKSRRRVSRDRVEGDGEAFSAVKQHNTSGDNIENVDIMPPGAAESPPCRSVLQSSPGPCPHVLFLASVWVAQVLQLLSMAVANMMTYRRSSDLCRLHAFFGRMVLSQ